MMTQEEIRNIAALIGTLMQTGKGQFDVRLNEQWKFRFSMGHQQSEFCLIFKWSDGQRVNTKCRQAFVDNEWICWDNIIGWLMRNSNKLEQWSK